MSALMFLCALLSVSGISSDTDLTPAIKFNYLTVDDGLSQGLVTDIVQDSLGYIWIGTYGGLNRYDGYEFRIFRNQPDDPSSIGDNYISSICPADDGTVWIGTRSGLNCWDPTAQQFTRLHHDPDNPTSLPHDRITDLVIDKQGVLWVSTQNGLARYDSSKGNFILYSAEASSPRSILKNRISKLFVDTEGSLWILFHFNIIRQSDDSERERTAVQRYNRQSDDFDTFYLPIDQLAYIQQVWSQPDGTLMFSTHRHGVFELDAQGKNIVVAKDPVLSNLRGIFMLNSTKDGTIYVSKRDGLLQYNPASGFQYLHTHNADDFHSIMPPGQITTIFEDSTGLLWLGSSGSGIATLSKSRYKFSTYRSEIEEGEGRGTQQVRLIYPDDDNGLWIATTEGYLHHFNKNGDTLELHRFDSAINGLTLDQEGSVWIGCMNGHIYLLSHGEDQPRLIYEAGTKISDLTLDTRGRVTVLIAEQGLANVTRNADGAFALTFLPFDIGGLVGTSGRVLFDANGRIWISRSAYGILMIEQSDGQIHVFRRDESNINSINSDTVTDILESPDGTIWISTLEGLNRFDEKTNGFVRFKVNAGNPNSLIYSLEIDEAGNFWCGTSQGLIKHNPSTNENIVYTKSDGLQSNQFTTGASCRLKTGELVFGGTRGFNRFLPANLPVNSNKPAVVITEMLINGNPVQAIPSGSLRLSYKENFITFKFAALDFTYPAENHYSFKLEGYNEDWNDAGTLRSISYYLSPGNYTLRAKASNNDGVWNDEGISLNISILPAFWDTWWFRSIVALLLIAGAVTWHIARNRAVRRRADQMNQLNQKLVTQMEEISSLNAALNTFDYSVSNALRIPIRHIKLFIEILQEGGNNLPQSKLDEYLRRTGEKADSLIKLVDALLTLSRAKRMNLRREKFKLSTVARKVASDLSLEGIDNSNIVIKDEIPCNADLQLVNILLSNLISNAMKFTQVKKNPVIEVGFKEKDSENVYYVKDNGVGISRERIDKVMEPFHAFHTDDTFEGIGLGLATSKLIVERHDGTIWLESEENQGTTAYFTLGKY